MRRLTARIESWPIAGAFTISRGSRTEALVVVATIEESGCIGRGECVPYARYGETVEGVAAQIEAMAAAIAGGASRSDLPRTLAPGAARNAIDCALWDLQAKQSGKRVWELAGVPSPRPVVTAYTLSLGPAEAMERAAREAASRPLLKVKLGGTGDGERIAAVRRGAPQARLVVDANEAWDEGSIAANLSACRAAGVELIEQPLPADRDAILAEFGADARHGIPLCADESFHTTEDLHDVAQRYQAINIKLDKAGGLTAAFGLLAEANRRGLAIMVGCMVGTSLAMAPALVLANAASYVDLDGPLLLARDRDFGLVYEGSLVQPFGPELWG
jgi:L-Ala-D/L-Glu epimerase